MNKEVDNKAKTTWKAVPLRHRGEKRIAVYFPLQTELIIRIKNLPGAKWSNTLKTWHLPDTVENRVKFKIESPEDPISSKAKEMGEFKLWLRSKRYSESK